MKIGRQLESIVILFLCTSLAVAVPASIRFVDQGGRTLLQVAGVMRNETLYLPVSVLRGVFDPDMKQQFNRLTEKLTLALNDTQIYLRIDTVSVTASKYKGTISLAHPPLVINNRPMLPIDFFTELLPRIHDINVEYNPHLKRVRVTEKNEPLSNLLQNPSSSASEGFLLVLDPGHGGADGGCRGNGGVLEKEVVLAIAKHVETRFERSQVRVVLTRDGDFEKRPSERSQFANRNGGQLFLSLHCNASFSKDVGGAHLYVNNSMGEIQSAGSVRATNAVLRREEIRALSQDDFLEHSRKFASILQDELESSSGRAVPLTEIPLVTLSGVYMPALLVELGYLSNGADRENLVDQSITMIVATTIAEAVLRYSASLNPAQENTDGG